VKNTFENKCTPLHSSSVALFQLVSAYRKSLIAEAVDHTSTPPPAPFCVLQSQVSTSLSVASCWWR